MLVRHSQHVETEILKWLMLMVLAGGLVLALASGAAGANEPREPRPLPVEVTRHAIPLEQASPQGKSGGSDSALPLWRVLELHRQGRFAEAIRGWESIEMPCETESWAHVARGMALHRLGETNRAEKAFHTARALSPTNPLASYGLALANLYRSEAAGEWYDALADDEWWERKNIPPLADRPGATRSLYELAALMEFERAIRDADGFTWDTPLVSRELILVSRGYDVVPSPLVADLLEAIGCEDFVARSAMAAGRLSMNRGAWVMAEKYYDDATACGENMSLEFLRMGELYAAQGRPSAAARAYLKAMHGSDNPWSMLKRAVDSTGQALWDLK